jgi:hypothetical protein
MPLGASRITLLARTQVVVAAEVLRSKVGVNGTGNISTTESKFGGSSYFIDDASSEYFATTNTATNFGTDNFTIEFWVYRTEDNQFDFLVDHRDTVDDDAVALVYSSTDNNVYLYINGAQRTTSSSDIPINTWTHIAIVRNAGSIALYINGTSEGTPYSNNNDFTTTNGLQVGKNILAGTSPTTAYFDEVRVSNTARYTGNFTAPTTPFVNDDNTLLLLHMDGTDGSTFFEDDNGVGRSAVGVAANGDAQVDTAQSQFGGASLSVTSTGDYLNVVDNSNLDFTNDYTIECWAYISSKAAGAAELFQINDSGTLRANIQFSSANNYGFVYYIPGFRVFDGNAGGLGYPATSAGQWYHIAFTKQGTAYRFFIDGVLRESATGTPTETHTQVTIGSLATSGVINPNAYLDEFRISNTARYTAAFTPSTAPFQNDANTLLLLHMDGTDASTVFRDDNGVGRSAIGVTAIADAQVDTAQSQFGGASAYFDGTDSAAYTGGYLELGVTATDLMPVGANPWTVECWFRPSAVDIGQGMVGMYLQSNGGRATFNISSTNYIEFFHTDMGQTTGSTQQLSINTWYHLAWCSDGTTMRMFVDGVQDGTDTVPGALDWSPVNIHIGDANILNGNQYLPTNGHIDEVRISNVARYTAAFTPSTAPFQNDANTLLLLHMDGTDASTVFTDDNGKEPA